LSTHPDDRPEGRLAGDRQLRADARRNRERVLEAADALFAEVGLKASVEEIAQRAGVGVGTVCRNFPTKEDLVAELLNARGEALLGEARAALTEPDPGAAFEHFVTIAAASSLRYRALAEEIASGQVPVRESLRSDVHDALDQLVRRAQRAGALRTDVTADDIKLLLSGLAQATVAAGNEGSLDRFVRVMLDGLRPAAAQRRRRTS
jgi:AcrR family transcriptional regulator